MSDFRIVPAGDSAWLVEWPARIEPAISARAVLFADRVRDLDPAVRDVVVGYCTATVYFDPLRVAPEVLERELRQIATNISPGENVGGAEIDVDVCYGAEFGPDLSEVAERAGMTQEEVIAL